MSSETDRHRPVTSEEFRRACGRFATGVSIASVLDRGGAPHGLTVNSFSSVSLEPPLVLISLGHQVSVINQFRAAKSFAINVLAAEQQPLSDRFARKGHDRFDGLEWRRGVTGVPLLPGVLAAIECDVYKIIPLGDHDLFIGEVMHVTVREGNPLLYFASSYRHL
uniref:Flavin reductase domain protein, FMN-binding n=1 Tax=Solibacter usitatus (strain Ellin6076) TaxID=234267 RepID=Q01W45_SOLUE